MFTTKHETAPIAPTLAERYAALAPALQLQLQDIDTAHMPGIEAARAANDKAATEQQQRVTDFKAAIMAADIPTVQRLHYGVLLAPVLAARAALDLAQREEAHYVARSTVYHAAVAAHTAMQADIYAQGFDHRFTQQHATPARAAIHAVAPALLQRDHDRYQKRTAKAQAALDAATDSAIAMLTLNFVRTDDQRLPARAVQFVENHAL